MTNDPTIIRGGKQRLRSAAEEEAATRVRQAMSAKMIVEMRHLPESDFVGGFERWIYGMEAADFRARNDLLLHVILHPIDCT